MIMDFITYTPNWEHYILSSIILGIIVSVCPCTMATNITALTAMSDKGKGGHHSFLRGVAFAWGKAGAYLALGMGIFLFAQGLHIGEFIQNIFGRIIGPIFIFIGVMTLDIIHIHGLEEKCAGLFDKWVGKISYGKAFLMGILLAFAFCPYSAALYFGMAVPSSLALTNGYWVPLFFAIGAVIPLIALSALFAYGFDSAKEVLQKFQRYELWFRRILGILFIISGVMFILEYYFE